MLWVRLAIGGPPLAVLAILTAVLRIVFDAEAADPAATAAFKLIDWIDPRSEL